MLNPDTVKATLVAEVAGGLDRLLGQAVDGATPEELLAGAEALARSVLRAAFSAGTSLAAEREEAPACLVCGRRMQRHERERRALVSLRGDVVGVFQRWRCRGCGEGACPGYDDWVRHGCTPEVAQAAQLAGAHQAYELSERLLAAMGVFLSDNTLQRLVREAGGELAAAREAEAEAVARLALDLTPAHRPERLYIEVDGFKAQVERAWREPRVGLCFETAQAEADEDLVPPPATRVSVVAALAKADEMLELLAAEAQRRGVMRAREVVLVADGAPWIWERLRGLAPPWAKVTEILDWYHLCENLAKAVRAAYGERGNAWWLEHLEEAAWAGDSNELLRRLATLRDRAPAGQRQREAANVIAYVRYHRGRMNYRQLQLDGYHVGSGNVESRCKQLGLRVKGAGMNWSEDGLNAVLALLAQDLSDEAVRWQPAA